MSLRNYWYIACESRRLAKRPLAVTMFGRALVVWRDAGGAPCAAEDRCAHRHAPLSAGAVDGGCLVCPYHGWRYDSDGRCVHVPSLADGRPRPAGAFVPAQRACEQDGYVWICPGEGTPPAHPRRFPHCDEPGWTTFRMRSRFATGLEACLENFLDCPHTATVHRGWFRTPDPREMDAIVRRTDDGVEVEFLDEPVSPSLVSRLFYPRGAKPRHTDRFLMPNISRVDYEFGPRHHYIITSQATPVSDEETEVFTVITLRHGRIGPLVRLAFEPMSRRIIRQDVDILAAHGMNRRRFGGDPRAEVHAETDLVALHMQAMRRRADRGEAPKAICSEQTIRIRF